MNWRRNQPVDTGRSPVLKLGQQLTLRDEDRAAREPDSVAVADYAKDSATFRDLMREQLRLAQPLLPEGTKATV